MFFTDQNRFEVKNSTGYCQVVPAAGVALLTLFRVFCYRMAPPNTKPTFIVYRRQQNTFNQFFSAQYSDIFTDVLYSNVEKNRNESIIIQSKFLLARPKHNLLLK